MSNILDFFANVLYINTVQTLEGFVMSNKLPDADSSSRRPRLLDEVRARLRVKHYSIRTETAYTGWIRRFILFSGRRHPTTLGKAEVEAFLTDLAVAPNVSAATQN